MEYITSRKNNYIKHLRALASSSTYRYEAGEYVCAGEKLFDEALESGAEITSSLWIAGSERGEAADGSAVSCPVELLEYASPLVDSKEPVFTVGIYNREEAVDYERAIVLDGVQNPGNVGTIIRTAAAFSFDAVFLMPGCADKYNPKTVQSAMGALFKCRVENIDAGSLRRFLDKFSMRLFGADLMPGGIEVRDVPCEKIVVAIGSEGAGLGAEVRSMLSGSFKIPISESTESLNAAVAAAVSMWEITRGG